MEKLLEALSEKGLNVAGQDEKVIKKLARTVGLDPVDYLPRAEVEVVNYKNQRDDTNLFIKTPRTIVGRKANGMAETVGGVFVRVSAARTIIKDLEAGLALAGDDE